MGENDNQLRNNRLVFYGEQVDAIDEVLDVFLEKSRASAALLIDVEGHLVTKKGFTNTLDTDAIAALAAGSFASTRALAKNLGEKEFSVIFHEGENDNIHISLASNRCLIVIIFDDRTTIGMVRLHAKDVTEQIQQILEKEPEHPEKNPLEDTNFRAQAETALDDFFGDE